MNKTNQRAYLAPEIEVMEISVEQGFGNSVTENTLERLEESASLTW